MRPAEKLRGAAGYLFLVFGIRCKSTCSRLGSVAKLEVLKHAKYTSKTGHEDMNALTLKTANNKARKLFPSLFPTFLCYPF